MHNFWRQVNRVDFYKDESTGSLNNFVGIVKSDINPKEQSIPSDDGNTSETSDKIRSKLEQALDSLKNTAKPACLYLSTKAHESLKKFNAVLPGNKAEIKRCKNLYVKELFQLFSRQQQKRKAHVYNLK